MLKFAAFLFYGIILFQSSFCIAQEHSNKEHENLINRALELKLDESLQWQRLVHYRKTRLDLNPSGILGWQSEADNPLFFVAKDGRENPRQELIETIRLGVLNQILPVAMAGADAMTVRCQYPARWKWILKELGVSLSTYPIGVCKRYDEFLEKQKPVSITLVFSGFYVDNPSSSFGHVLLRMNRVDHVGEISTGAELLDYGVGYAANATTGNPVLYAIGGFAGWFPSTFSSLPYYYKVREYSDAESRDLWEYDLNLQPDEVERVADHLWELGSTYFNYYYLKQNCAYHLLALIEAAAPRVNLLERVPFYIIPIDTVKAVNEEPNLVRRVTYRPSTARILRERVEQLTNQERDLYFKIRNNPRPADEVAMLPKDSAARVLDTVLDDIDYRHFRELVFKTNPDAASRKQNVLMARAQLPVGGEVKVAVTDRDRPDRSHGSGRWWLGAGQQKKIAIDQNSAPASASWLGLGAETSTVYEGEVRFAIHDIHDPLDGYLPSSSVEFWRMRGRWDTRVSQFELQSFSLFTVTSLSPLNRIDLKPAWRVNLGLDRVRDRRCDGCLSATTNFSGGASFEPLKTLMVYGLAGPRLEASASFYREKWLGSAGLLGGFRWKATRSWQISSEFEWRRVFDREVFDRNSGLIGLRWDYATTDLKRPIAIEGEFSFEPNVHEAFLRFIRYF